MPAVQITRAGDLRHVLTAPDAVDIDHLVLVSSAVVYGAWADNPLPLTEDAPVRPNPGFTEAAVHAEAERLAWEWLDEHPSMTLTVLRPTVVVGDPAHQWLVRALGPGHGATRTGAPPRQFLHADDLAAALGHVTETRLAGLFNVAPDGWAPGGATDSLAARRPGKRNSLPGSEPYLRHPWVVANDRLRATGWAPGWTTEEAVVATERGSWWRELSPRRRQEVTLGASGAGIIGAAAVAAAVIRSQRERRRG